MAPAPILDLLKASVERVAIHDLCPSSLGIPPYDRPLSLIPVSATL